MRTSKPEESEVLIQKLRSDMGIHRNPRKGTLNAPEQILGGLELEKKVFVDEVFPDEFSLEETQGRIERNTEELLEYDGPVISIGGDHSVSFPVLKVLKEENPDLKLVWLDAHLDLKEKIDGHVSHDVVVRELLDNGFSEEDIVFVGVTRIDHDERKFLESRDFQIYRPGEVEEFLESRPEGDLYLSVDVDVLKPEEAPGTGYPDGELDLEKVLEIVNDLRPLHADIVEVAPPFDEESSTVESAQKVLGSLVENCGRQKDSGNSF
ncbi:MAG: arginase family protein [Candidatus Nanohaloarchaea archaeon]